ncbi:MAG: GNAT family N-acetyltransferase [Myxococcota bacterium]|jgi:GNAT superfamily N-acetyltransferase|nr:GNAT family N-acetyltransferase [Myxococcota bacterium]
MTSFQIRAYEPRDIGPVTSLVRSVRAAAELGADFGGLGVDVRGAGRGEHARANDGPASETWVAEDDGEIVGVAAVIGVDPDVCALRRLYVAPARQGRGVGSALLAAIQSWSADQGFGRIVAQVPGALAPAGRFLAHRGFTATSGDEWVHENRPPRA